MKVNTYYLLLAAFLFTIPINAEIKNSICDELSYGGTIAEDHGVCFPGDVPNELVNVELPGPGSNDIEYIWIFTNDDPNENIANWIPIQGSNSEDYQPEPIFEDTWFRRCARRVGCTHYNVESNWVRICVDLEGPQFFNVADDFTIDCSEEPFFTPPEYYDDCSGIAGSTSFDEVVDRGCEIDYIRTWIVNDNCGKENFISQKVTSVDNEPPVITLAPPYNDFVNGDTLHYQCDFGIFFLVEDAIVTDNCDDDPTVIFVDDVNNSDDCSENGYKRFLRCYWRAVDACGNESLFILYIYEVDTIAPVFTYVPEDVMVECHLDPEFGTPTFEDNCPGEIQLDQNTELEGSDCDYLATRTWTITDECGNQARASQTIQSADVEAPVIHLNEPYQDASDGDTLIIACGNFVELDVTVVDNCDLVPDVVFYDDFDRSEDCEEDGYLTKMYCTWTATDECGNMAIFSVYVFIVDNDPPVFLSFPEDMTIACTEDPEFGIPEVYDACDVAPTLTEETKIIEVNCKFKYQRTWTVRDACGNSTVKTQVIFSFDEEAPVIEELLPVLGNFCDDYEIQYPIVSDDCDGELEIYKSIDTIVGEDFIDLKINWTVIDDCGNEAYAYQPVTIPCGGDGFGFLGFEATEMNESNIALTWTVRNEDTPAFYNVEVSKNGVDFESTNFSVEAGGVAYQGFGVYQMELPNTYVGRSFYRVKYLPQLGTSALSDQDDVMMNVASDDAFIYPNPFINNITIEFLDGSLANGDVFLYDAMGVLVKQISITSRTNYFVINLDDIQPGTYILTYSLNNQNYSQRIVKLTD